MQSFSLKKPVLFLSALMSMVSSCYALPSPSSINGTWCTPGKTTFFLYESDKHPIIPKKKQWCFTFDVSHANHHSGLGRFSFIYLNIKKKTQVAAYRLKKLKVKISHDIGIFSYITLDKKTKFTVVDSIDESIYRLRLIQPNHLTGLIEEVNHHYHSHEAFAGVLDLVKVSNTVPKDFLKSWHQIHREALIEYAKNHNVSS